MPVASSHLLSRSPAELSYFHALRQHVHGSKCRMIFTLTYDGPLSGSHRGASAKHHIRTALHPQLKALWDREPLFTRKAAVDRHATGDGAGVLLKTVNGRQFATLVDDHYRLRAKLNVLMLRRDDPGSLITHGGDIDNRLKTLLDALQRPQTSQEIPGSWSPTPEEDPLYCLLDDDRLVTRLDVETAHWLEPGDSAQVRLIITVDIWTPILTYWALSVAG